MQITFLGTIIQETLNWTSHIDRTSNKISRTVGVMNKLKHVPPGHVKYFLPGHIKYFLPGHIKDYV